MKKLREKNRKRLQRKLHIRKKINGTNDRPRISVFKSNKHISVQAIDDVANITIANASTLSSSLRGSKKNVVTAAKVGAEIGAKLKDAKVKKAVFDRNGYRFHGVIKAVADGVRDAGITL